MESPAITRYVQLSHDLTRVAEGDHAVDCSYRGGADCDCNREGGPDEPTMTSAFGSLPDRVHSAITAELDTLWIAMDADEKDETERRLGPLYVRSAMYDTVQCHTCSRVLFEHRRGSTLPWRAVGEGHPLCCRAEPSGPRFTLCQSCASKALEACDNASYEQMIEDHLLTPPGDRNRMPVLIETQRIDSLLVNQAHLIELQSAQIEALKKLDDHAETALKTASELEASSAAVIENQRALINSQQAQIESLERLVLSLGGSLLKRPSA